MMKRRSTDRNTRWLRMIERWGLRRAKQALVLASALYLALMIAAAALLIAAAALLLAQGPPWERRLRAGLIGILALIALWLWLRVLRAQWGRLRVVTQASEQDGEDTGIWGVGGPGMRTPGTTGLSRILPRRRAQDAEDSDNSP